MSSTIDRTEIQGWGADLDVKNRPAYPKERTPPRFVNVHWTEIEQQPETVKVFHSLERPGLTPVFGTTVPPKWVSGWIRGAAFKWSENDLRHWLLLLMADRMNVAEGIVEDLASGHVPNIFAEMGIKSELKYNRQGVIRKAVIAAGVVGVLGLYFASRKSGKAAGS